MYVVDLESFTITDSEFYIVDNPSGIPVVITDVSLEAVQKTLAQEDALFQKSEKYQVALEKEQAKSSQYRKKLHQLKEYSKSLREENYELKRNKTSQVNKLSHFIIHISFAIGLGALILLGMNFI